jgi:hypothetical protein
MPDLWIESATAHMSEELEVALKHATCVTCPLCSLVLSGQTYRRVIEHVYTCFKRPWRSLHA